VLADQPADVGAVRAGFAAEAGGVRRVLERQETAVEDLAAIEIGDRDLGGRDEVQVPVAADLEQVLLELRQLAGAVERGAVDQEGRLDLGVAVLAGVQRQHEVDQRAFQLGAGAEQHGEAGAGDLGGALEVDDAELRAQIPVRLRLEVERPRLAPRPHDDVVGGAPPDRHRRVGQIGQPGHQAGALLLDAVELDFELLDLLAAQFVGLEDRPGVEALALGPRHFVRGGVLLALEPFELRDQAAAVRLEAGELFELGRDVETAIDKTCTHRLEIVANVGGIQHVTGLSCAILIRCRRRFVRPCSPPPVSARVSCPPPRRCPRRC